MTIPPSEPRPATVVANGRRHALRHEHGATSSAMNDAPSSTRIVEIENQSMCGVWII